MALPRRAWGIAQLGLILACGHPAAPPEERPWAVPSAEEPAPSAADEALALAVARYHDNGDLALLRAWLRVHPEHEDAEIWREVVALRTYEQLVLEASDDAEGEEEALAAEDALASVALRGSDPDRLAALAGAFPETIGGKTARAMLEEHALRRLTEPPFNPALIRFLEGDDGWRSGEAFLGIDDADFRARHEARLRRDLGGRLVSDACKTTLGYCTWWITQYPDDDVTGTLRPLMKEIWYRRAHPPWRSSNYANCAFHCARDCRRAGVSLHDTCYDACMPRCA